MNKAMIETKKNKENGTKFGFAEHIRTNRQRLQGYSSTNQPFVLLFVTNRLTIFSFVSR